MPTLRSDNVRTVPDTTPRGLQLDLKPQPWMEAGLCRQVGGDAWYPGGRSGYAKIAIAKAVAVCADCTVKAECLAYALEHNEQHGIWGGTTPRQRRKSKRGEVVLHV